VVVLLKIETDSNGTVTAFFPNAKDQCHNLRWNAKPDIVGPTGQVPETSSAVLLIALLPDIVERPRDSKKPTGLTDIAAQALRMLQHAKPGLHLSRLDLLVNWILHPEPPAVGQENNPPVRDVY
jgi:hypothetical protein